MIRRNSGSMKMKPIGLIGVGTMGRIILERLMEQGYGVCACDPVPEAQKYCREAGAQVAASPLNVAESADIILLSLPGPAQIETVVTAETGLEAALGGDSIVIDLSTVDPETTRRMSGKVAERGAAYLDAPILGRPASVGRWVLPVGGDAETLERSRQVLGVFASKAVHVGPSGAGNTLKLLNQLMFSTINGITSEVLAISEKAGLSPKVLFETISSSGAATVSGLFCEVAKKIVEGNYDPIFSVALLCKDAGLGIEMAKGFGATPLIASLVQSLNYTAASTGLADQDTSALVKVYKRLYQSDSS
jgi:3-hydroxyisobutyrate dehydrogenase-like beta-hydroxyacid dehydrogenase